MDINRQAFKIDQKMHKKIPHLLTLISWAPLDAEKSYIRKIVQKIDLTGVEIMWVELKSNKPVGLTSLTCCYLIIGVMH